ncbi:hypothetical protein KDH_19620 [Dictyobacter sp. S3.2.2.5]|uniref:Uncharacterized protein n=1 Tax=Dictyobacter halimunensis TaxID=3026934 RepID=A0ABQ6FND5_9CHLR|nr:hypothetical protein KDH_19620 [Dictyobacter sp. S3.2.2.5]
MIKVHRAAQLCFLQYNFKLSPLYIACIGVITQITVYFSRLNNYMHIYIAFARYQRTIWQ